MEITKKIISDFYGIPLAIFLKKYPHIYWKILFNIVQRCLINSMNFKILSN